MTERTRSAKGNEPVPSLGVESDYPLLYERSVAFDFAERLGGSTSVLDAEIDKAVREIWDARRFAGEVHV